MRKNIALGVAAGVAGIYGYVMWKKQVAIFEEAIQKVKKLKVLLGYLDTRIS